MRVDARLEQSGTMWCRHIELQMQMLDARA